MIRCRARHGERAEQARIRGRTAQLAVRQALPVGRHHEALGGVQGPRPDPHSGRGGGQQARPHGGRRPPHRIIKTANRIGASGHLIEQQFRSRRGELDGDPLHRQFQLLRHQLRAHRDNALPDLRPRQLQGDPSVGPNRDDRQQRAGRCARQGENVAQIQEFGHRRRLPPSGDGLGRGPRRDGGDGQQRCGDQAGEEVAPRGHGAILSSDSETALRHAECPVRQRSGVAASAAAMRSRSRVLAGSRPVRSVILRRR